MPIGAIITLCAVAIALVGFVIYLLIVGGTPKYPKGRRFSATVGKLKTTVIVSDDVPFPRDKAEAKRTGEALTRYCSHITQIVRQTFQEASIVHKRAFKRTKHVIVCLLDTHTYNYFDGGNYLEYYKKSAACMGLTRCRIWGEEVPTARIKVKMGTKLVDVLNKCGQPFVHELCHAMLDDYVADEDDHADPMVFGGSESIEAIAAKKVEKTLQEWHAA